MNNITRITLITVHQTIKDKYKVRFADLPLSNSTDDNLKAVFP